MTGLLIADEFKQHQTAFHHPECPERIDAAFKGVRDSDLLSTALKIPLRHATTEELLLCHEPEHVLNTERLIAEGADELSSGDVSVCSKSAQIARLAVGSILNAVDLVLSNQIKNAFCAVRPPGHHASARRAMGFCIYNNVSLAARYAQQRYGLTRVAIIDWDVHHGNGTQDIFYDDPNVLYCSTHQAPWYPGTGWANERGGGPGEGFTINFPLPAGTPGKQLLPIYTEQILPAVRLFSPDLILISAGFDARIDDPLGHFRLTDSDFAELTSHICDLANDLCNGRLISILEGGYHLQGLASAIEAHTSRLLN